MEKTEIFVEEGQRVGDRYTLVEHLGTGGFAKVYRAFDESIERDVAIKFLDLRGVHGDQKMVNTVLERFRREAKLAAKIKHRNVVQIYDIGQVGSAIERPYIVMELLSGHDLEEQLVSRGPMKPEQLLGLYVDALDALGEAHDLGIVHKDLKPSNLFLSDPGTRSEALRIVDFGIAHLQNPGERSSEDGEGKRGARARLTATGQILGTLQYLTPEYINEQVVTPALDVYQMALILVELLSGQRVIDTDNAFECLRIHTFGLLELPDYLLDSPLGPVLRRALHSEYDQRIPNAKAFADELSTIDAASIPVSPWFDGDGSVATSQFLNTKSHPALPARYTSQPIESPSTSQLSLEAQALVDREEALADTALYEGPRPSPEEEPSAPSEETPEQVPALTAISPSVERDRLTTPEPISMEASEQSQGLKMLVGIAVTLLLVGAGIVVMSSGPSTESSLSAADGVERAPRDVTPSKKEPAVPVKPAPEKKASKPPVEVAPKADEPKVPVVDTPKVVPKVAAPKMAPAIEASPMAKKVRRKGKKKKLTRAKGKPNPEVILQTPPRKKLQPFDPRAVRPGKVAPPPKKDKSYDMPN